MTKRKKPILLAGLMTALTWVALDVNGVPWVVATLGAAVVGMFVYLNPITERRG
jgi:hypothetical protein